MAAVELQKRGGVRASGAFWRRFGRDRVGAVSIELALVAIVLGLVCMGTYDFARYGIGTFRVSQAARAGLQYALQDPTNAGNVDAIKQAVRNDAQDTTNQLTIIVGAPFCGCPGQVAAACGTTCTDGGHALEYVELTVQSAIEMAFSYPGIPSTIPISTTSQIRLN